MRTRRAQRRLEVTFAGQVWDLRNPDAYQWLLMVHADDKDLSHVFPGLIRDRDLDRMLDAAGDLDPADFQRRCTNTARVAMSRACGWEWYRCRNLLLKAADNWTIVNGTMLLEGCDAQVMDLPSWLSAAYVAMVRNLDKEDRMKFEFEIDKPPAGVRIKQSPAKVRQSMAAFAAD